MSDNIDGEGDPFTLASQAGSNVFLSGGRVCIESSPGWLIEDPKWQYRDPHEGPPCQGHLCAVQPGRPPPLVLALPGLVARISPPRPRPMRWSRWTVKLD